MIKGLTLAEMVALFTSFLALIISIINIHINGVFNKKVKKKSKKHLSQAQQLVEIAINESINLSCDRIEFIRKQIESRRLQNLDSSLFVNLIQSFEADLYKQYDHACKLYWENKINRERFKRIYKSEIIQLVEGEHQNPNFANQKTEYPNLLRVCKRWNSTKYPKRALSSLKFQTS